MSKKETRERILKIRQGLTPSAVEKMSVTISWRLQELPEFVRAGNIMMYVSVRNEVDTLKLINRCLQTGKKVFLPRVECKKIRPAEVKDLFCLEPGKFGIPEPKSGECNPAARHRFDVIIVPGIAFDPAGNRIGFGHGYYDGFLENAEGLKIGLAYDFQIVEKVAQSELDVPMDVVITENNIFRR
jgi:5-formyltetrahydrofolate cyclo-ligase